MLGQDNNALMAQLLRKRHEQEAIAKRSAFQSQNYANAAQSMNPSYTVGGHSAAYGGQPAPVALDWGSILGTGVSNYMSAKKGRETADAEEQMDILSQDLMRETLGSDPEAMRLMYMVQAGVPGAEEALSQKVNPKREAMGAALQYIQSGMADPNAAEELAPRFGISPETFRHMAERANSSINEREQTQWQRGLEADLLKQENLYNLKSQQKAAGTGAGDTIALTPGEKQMRAKLMAEADKELMTAGVSDSKFQEVLATVERDDAFGPSSKLSEFLAESPNRTIAAIGRTTQSEGQLKLKEYLTSEVLKRMAMLGGNDSNEELNRITASLPTALSNKEAAMAMLKALHEWEQVNRLAIKLRRDDLQSGAWFGSQPTREDYYRKAKQMTASGQQGNPQPQAPQQLQGLPTEQIQSIESLLDELGIVQ